jgi:hypothetical protein
MVNANSKAYVPTENVDVSEMKLKTDGRIGALDSIDLMVLDFSGKVSQRNFF